MGRRPLHGALSFRFFPEEVAEMEATFRQLTGRAMFPSSFTIELLAKRFSFSPARAGIAGIVTVTPKKVLTWFQNRRYGPRRKENKAERRAEQLANKTVLPASSEKNDALPAAFKQQHLASSSSSSAVPLSVQAAAAGSPGCKPTGRGQLPGEMMPSECGDLHSGDLVLCFQQRGGVSLYLKAEVTAIQRVEHDAREGHCRFLVRFERDNELENVGLAKLRCCPPPIEISSSSTETE